MTVAISRNLGPVPIDVVVREVHESDLVITSNPVESGAEVSDHAYMEPRRLTLEAVAASRDVDAGAVSRTYEDLVRLQASRQPFDVVTGLTLYRRMLIERITVNRDTRFGRVLFFAADLREVIIVDTQSAPGVALSRERLAGGPAADRGTPTRNSGNTVAREVTNPADRSSLQSILDALLGRRDEAPVMEGPE